jgi:beta-phosphoglucomutase-like phosphatase (HAD superfamily)
MRIRGAIFDIDGVLVDSPHERAWRESLQQLMAGPWRDLAAQTSYAPDRYTTAVYQQYVSGKPRFAGAAAALAYFGVPDPDGRRVREYGDAKQLTIVELIARGAFTVFDDGVRFLLKLKAAGVRLAAASSSKNANTFLAKILVPDPPRTSPDDRPAPHGGIGEGAGDHCALLDVFDANVCGRDFAHGKPDPEIFLTAAAELDLAPDVCLVVEDAVSGVQAAGAGGMFCIGIARLDDVALLRAAGADLVVTSLDHVRLEDL